MASAFLGSGSSFLSRYDPVYDRFDFDESDDDLRISSDSIGSQTDIATLDEVGYSFTPFGGIILHSKKEKVEAIFKKTKVPFGTTIHPLGPRECGICLTDIEEDEEPSDSSKSNLVQTSCLHNYCRECLSYYLHLQSGDLSNLNHVISRLETNENGHFLRIDRVCGVVCPHPKCNKIIEGEEFRSLVDESTWDRFNHLALLILLRGMERIGEVAACPQKCGGFVQKCMCTTAECRERALMMAEKERARLHKLWQRAEAQSMSLLRKWANASIARQCPKCSMLIEKNGGCDHMFCTHCKTHYSWSASSASTSF